ncbi:MAG: TonB-dependent receptor plug domain-containing protein [Treponema sp.]|nr:TonB-dependent receptor plug domain-containing protein [Treponema sp.]
MMVIFLCYVNTQVSADDGEESDFEDWVIMEGLELVIEAEAPRQDVNPAVPERSALGARANIVSGEQIQQQGSLDFSDTLRNVPGVIVGQRNIAGTTTGSSLYVRGRGYSHPSTEITVHFDGVPRHGFIFGQSMADGIPVNVINHVEVRKSPQPSEFGAGYALINIEPRYMDEYGWITEGGFSAGSFSTFSQNAAFGLRSGRFDIFAAQSWVSTNGHVVHSGARQQSYYINTGLLLNANWELRFLANYAAGFTEQAPYTGQSWDDILSSYRTNSFFSTITLRNEYANAAGFLRLYYTNTQFQWLDEDDEIPGDWSLQSLQAFGARAREEFSIFDRGLIAVGMDLDWKLMVNEDHNPHRQTIITTFPAMILYSPFFGASWMFGSEEGFRIMPSAGIRGFLHSVWANQLSWQGGLAIGWRNLDLNFNYSRGLIFPAPAVILGLLNFNLFNTTDLSRIEPETIDHFEAGITLTNQSGSRFSFSLDASYFYNIGRNRIILVSQVPGNASAVSSFALQGLELAGSFGFSPARLLADTIEIFAGGTWYTDLTAVDEDGNVARKMPFTPLFSLSAGFRWVFFENFSLSGDLKYLHEFYSGGLGLSPSFTEPLAENRLNDIFLLNLRAGFRFENTNWRLMDSELFVSVNNVLNVRYEYYAGFVMPGITFMIGFNFRFR